MRKTIDLKEYVIIINYNENNSDLDVEVYDEVEDEDDKEDDQPFNLNYLTQNFIVKDGEIVNKNASNSFSLNYSKSQFSLCFELEKIFNLKRKEIKWYVKSWCYKQNKGFNFDYFWRPRPLGNKNINSRFYQPIPNHLVPVQPMLAPTVYAPYILMLQTPQIV